MHLLSYTKKILYIHINVTFVKLINKLFKNINKIKSYRSYRVIYH